MFLACRLPLDPGPCTGQERKYYFDTQTRHCQQFMYGGCQGNGNRFSSLLECERTCHELLIHKEVGEYNGFALMFLQLSVYIGYTNMLEMHC